MARIAILVVLAGSYRSLLIKRELVDALVQARTEGKTPIASTTSSSSSTSTSSDHSIRLQRIKPPSLNNLARNTRNKEQEDNAQQDLNEDSGADTFLKQYQRQSILEARDTKLSTEDSTSQLQKKRTSLIKQESLNLNDVFEKERKQSMNFANESIIIPDDMDLGLDLIKTKSKQRKSFNTRMLKIPYTESSLVSIDTNPTAESSTSSDYSASSSEEDSSCASEYSSSFTGQVPSPKIGTQQDVATCCAVSHMPYKYKQLNAIGLYSGHIDIASKLPNGFGALKCDNGDIFSGTWKMGVL